MADLPPDRFRTILLAGATVGGLGRLRPAPGTWGSLAGLLAAWAIHGLSFPPTAALASSAALALLAVPICGRAARLLGGRDPACVVLDEAAAVPLVFVAAPWRWDTAAVGFLLFRLFDVAKPWPVCWCERLPGGWGIVADDVAAALMSALALLLLARAA